MDKKAVTNIIILILSGAAFPFLLILLRAPLLSPLVDLVVQITGISQTGNDLYIYFWVADLLITCFIVVILLIPIGCIVRGTLKSGLIVGIVGIIIYSIVNSGIHDIDLFTLTEYVSILLSAAFSVLIGGITRKTVQNQWGQTR